MCYAKVKHYHGDNGIFLAEEYCKECLNKNQTQSFWGVGAQHQNATAEHAIQTIMYMAQTFLLHSSLHWSERGSDDISLWPFAVKHAVWLYNIIPNCLSGLTLLELITKSKADHRGLLCSHMWGCQTIVLEPQLQNDQKLPKRNRRACIGQFLGYLDQHLSLVANVRHMSTGHVSPHFLDVFDDLFKMVIQDGDNDLIVNSIYDGLFERNWELYIEDEFDADDNLIYTPPPLHDVWLNETGCHQGKEDLLWQCRRNEELMPAQRQNVMETIRRTLTLPSVVDSVPDHTAVSDDESVASSVCSQNSEPERDYVDDFDDDDSFVHIPNTTPVSNKVNEGAGLNIVPEGDDSVQAPEGVSVPPVPYICRTHGKARKNPPGRWIRGADGRMEHINMCELK
jgi:hypothetical protein